MCLLVFLAHVVVYLMCAGIVQEGGGRQQRQDAAKVIIQRKV